MSTDDDTDLDLLALLRASLGLNASNAASSVAETGVLASAEHVYNHSIDVALDTRGTKAAAQVIWTAMREKQYSRQTWSTHELHPQSEDGEATVDFIFTMDLLNFCFWSTEEDPHCRFQVEYRGKRWSGYWSLVAALQRAIEEGGFSPFMSSSFFYQGKNPSK